LQVDDHFRRKNKPDDKLTNKPYITSYKQILNRVRERSKEHALDNSKSFMDSPKTSPENKNFIFTRNIQNLEFKPKSPLVKLANIGSVLKLENEKIKFDEEDENMISILNSNNRNFDLMTSKGSQNYLKESTIEGKAEFYDDNLFDLIEDIENNHKIKLDSNIVENRFVIDYDKEKE